MSADVVALTAQGRLRGTRDGQALRFLGIPYAESPATAGRFSAPVPHARWDGVRDALAAAYLDRAGPPGSAVGQAVTDRVFRVPAQRLAAAKAAAGGTAFTYDFRWTTLAGPLAGLAFHCLDVPFFFDALAEPGATAAAGPAPPQELATRMHSALVRFVTEGDPGWERFGDDRSPVMIFDEPSEVREDPLELERAAWRQAR